MQQRTEKKKVIADNAWGRSTTSVHQDFEVEKSDAGAERPHYLGHNHRDYTFTQADVGRIITVMSDGSGWTCWSFKT